MLHTLGLHERKLTNVVQPSIPWKPKLIYVVNTNRERGCNDECVVVVTKVASPIRKLSLSVCVYVRTECATSLIFPSRFPSSFLFVV